MSEIPKVYTKGNSWVKVDKGIATVGVSEAAAKKVKEFVFIKLPVKGAIKRGETYVSLEAVKWSGHLESPVSGEIIDVNQRLYDEPSAINKDPQGSWIMKVKMKDPKELDD
ncbi:MAG: glycine cleavage system protein H [Candidatus Aenigmatarchaeota archaeon]